MDHIKKSDIREELVHGTYRKMVFGVNGYIQTDDAEMAYCRVQDGNDAPAHCCKGCEMVYINDLKNGYLRVNEGETLQLKMGDVLMFDAGETYQFLFEADDGYADIVLFSPLKKAD